MRRCLAAAAALAVTALVAGCAGGPAVRPAGRSDGTHDPSVAELRDQADVAACPAVSSASAAPAGGDASDLPDVTLPCLSGGPDVPLRGLAGVPMVVNLWATWCTPCRTELPGFQKAFERADPARLRVLGIVTEDPGLSRPLSFAVDTGVRLPSLVDDDGTVFTALGIRGLPATLFVAPDGSVTHVHSGPLGYPELGELTEKYLHVQINA